MKRWIFTILLFLLLGAIVNVAVAWGCYWRGHLSSGARPSLEPALAEELFRKWGGQLCVDEHLYADGDRNVGATFVLFGVMAPSRSSGIPEALALWRAGWPLCSVEGAQHFVNRDAGVGPKESNIMLWSPPAAIGSSLPFHAPRGWPLKPSWPGFIVNTLFYGVILWLLIPGPFVLQRLIRVKRGRCPKCGYDLRGAPSGGGCPECGWNRFPAPRSAVETDAV
ncbi:MAG: hypothetical protein SYC29_03625 [Planctomycetota bacterium]|nr:hypothetical protein [Planctomycetota bacterium]